MQNEIQIQPTKAAETIFQPRKPFIVVTSQTIEAQPSRISSRPAKIHAHRFTHDAENYQLVNAPLAFTAFFVLAGGILGMCCGMIIGSPWLATTSFLLSLVGSSMYGWSLYADGEI